MAIYEEETELPQAVQVQYFQLLAQLQLLEILASFERYPSQHGEVERRWAALLTPYLSQGALHHAFLPHFPSGRLARDVKEPAGLVELCRSSLNFEAEKAKVRASSEEVFHSSPSTTTR